MAEKTDAVAVAIRVRPLTPSETALGRTCISVDSQSHQITVPAQGKTYTYDYVADCEVSQAEMFAAVGRSVADSVLAGLNGTIFAYGQTGTGKTYTIQGTGVDTLTTDPRTSGRGLLPRCFEHLFASVQAQSQVTYSVTCSYLEIYQEQIIDLLVESPEPLHIREDSKQGVYVDGLLEVPVTSILDTYDLVSVGAHNRHIAATNMNKESSRSHSVFTMILHSQENTGTSVLCKTSKFCLVDLAGSERQKGTSAAGARLKEAGKINKSLSALGNVINSLSDISQGKSRHVHYRDSKLTFLLKDSLGGNSRTVLIANISAAAAALGETSSTLQFASRAKLVKCRPVVNIDLSELDWLRAELARAKEALANFICPICNGNNAWSPVCSELEAYKSLEIQLSETANDQTESLEQVKSDGLLRHSIQTPRSDKSCWTEDLLPTLCSSRQSLSAKGILKRPVLEETLPDEPSEQFKTEEMKRHTERALRISNASTQLASFQPHSEQVEALKQVVGHLQQENTRLNALLLDIVKNQYSKARKHIQMLSDHSQLQQGTIERLRKQLKTTKNELLLWKKCVTDKNQVIQNLNQSLKAKADENMRDQLAILNSQLTDTLNNSQCHQLQRIFNDMSSKRRVHDTELLTKAKDTLEKKIHCMEEFVNHAVSEALGTKPTGLIHGVRLLYEKIIEHSDQNIMSLTE